MDYSGTAQLEWRAHAGFAVTGSVQLQVRAVDNGWAVRALSMTREDHWAFLVFDNPFTLRFPDGSSFEVGIGRPGPDGSFEVWDWTLHEQHLPVCRRCGAAVAETSVTDNAGQDLLGPVTVTERCSRCGDEHQTEYRLHSVDG